MPDSVERHTLDHIPDESDITTFRDRAADKEVSVETTFPSKEGEQKRLVVSPRGTVVLLNDVSEETFNQSRSAAEIAAALHE